MEAVKKRIGDRIGEQVSYSEVVRALLDYEWHFPSFRCSEDQLSHAAVVELLRVVVRMRRDLRVDLHDVLSEIRGWRNSQERAAKRKVKPVLLPHRKGRIRFPGGR